MAPQREWLDTDYYAVLGVAKDADQAAIKKAYRRLARENHPDANPDDRRAEQRFKEIGAAYHVLGDAQSRKEYDELRRLGAAGTGRGGVGGNGFGGGSAFEDVLGQVFKQGGFGGFGGGGGGRRQRRGRNGRDVETDVHLSFDDALSGLQTRLQVHTEVGCGTCHGSGARPGTTPTMCPQCGGSGQLQVDQGPFAMASPCPRCGGEGRVIVDPCPTCRGSRVQSRPAELKVRIPAGVRDGATIRVPGKGNPGDNGGRAGDLLVHIHVEPDPLFSRRGDDVLIDVPVTYAEAVLGTNLTVPTPSGASKTIKVPEGTETGSTFRLRGEGAPGRNGVMGDLLVTLHLEVPAKPSRRQRQLVQQLAELDDHRDRDRLLRRREDGHTP